MINLSKLSKAKYLQGAELAKINAKRHQKIANLCQQEKEYGIGISHLVLAIEEFSKSAILYIRYLDNRLPVVELSKYFTSHKKKHKTIESFISGIVLSSFSKSSITELKNSLTWFNIALLGIILYIIDNLLSNVKTVDNKILTLEELRKYGFYVDYTADGNWKAPQNQFSAKAFHSLNLQVTVVVSAFYSYLDEIENKEKSIDSFIDILVSANLIDKQQWEKILKTKKTSNS